MVIWLTGLSGAGKTTIARSLQARLKRTTSDAVSILDGDDVRENISPDLGFSKADRDEQVRRVGWVAGLLNKHGGHVIVALISPYARAREKVRRYLTPDFMMVYVSCPLSVCEQRDVKGLYRLARCGGIKNFTGINDPYDDALDAEVVVDTSTTSLGECVDAIIAGTRS